MGRGISCAIKKYESVATTGFFYAADTTQNALKEYYPHINEGMKRSNGQGFPKQMFAQGADERSVMLVGSPQQIIEKMLYQHEQFGHQRYMAQLDFGGVPFEKLAKKHGNHSNRDTAGN